MRPDVSVPTIKTSITIPAALLSQVKTLARHLDSSQNRVIQLAIEQFVETYRVRLPLDDEGEPIQGPPGPGAHTDLVDRAAEITCSDPQRVVNRGDVYWLQREGADDAEPEIRHPYVVIQEDVLNHSRLDSVVVCALTSNLKRASYPGNVLLDADEAALPKQSVVEVSKVSAIEKTQLGEYIGSLSEPRVGQILAGMRFLQSSYFSR